MTRDRKGVSKQSDIEQSKKVELCAEDEQKDKLKIRLPSLVFEEVDAKKNAWDSAKERDRKKHNLRYS